MSELIDTEPILKIEGRVARPVHLTRSELSSRARDDRSGAGVGVGELLGGAGVEPEATHVTVIAQGDAYRASIPIDELGQKGWLLIDAPDAPGGAFRLVVPEGRTLCWNVKHVATLRVTQGAEPDDVPENPTH